MKVFARKCTAILLAMVCLGGAGTAMTFSPESPISIVASATQDEDICPLLSDVYYAGTYNKEFCIVNGKGVSSFKAFTFGGKVAKVTIKDASGKVISEDKSCVSTKVLVNWSNSTANVSYLRIAFRKPGRCTVIVKHSDGTTQTIKVTARSYKYSYNDPGYATNVGLVSHGLTAVSQKWLNVWTGNCFGNIKNNGIITTYRGVGGKSSNILDTAIKGRLKWGNVSNMPKVHGLGVCTSDKGGNAIYIGNNTVVASEGPGVSKYVSKVSLSKYKYWYYVPGVKYPVTGFVKIDGKTYYYRNGVYLTNRTIVKNGVNYKLDANGVSNKIPPASEYNKTQYRVQYAYQA